MKPITWILVAGAITSGAAASGPIRTLDRHLCGFPLQVTISSRAGAAQASASALKFTFDGPVRITLRNATTGKTAVLDSAGSQWVDTQTGTIAFGAPQIWWWAASKHVPFLETGAGKLRAPRYVVSGAAADHVIDPCALVGRPATVDTSKTAPWKLPEYTLSHIARAGLVPVVGAVIRHKHVHLDVIVDGVKLHIPAGIGLAEPVDTGSGYFAQVANSPLHTHEADGIIHIESDRLLTFRLGAFFREWGVRLDAACVGAYCAGHGKELRVYVGGRRVSGDPRRIVLENHQEIAVVFGGPGAFRSVPSIYPAGTP